MSDELLWQIKVDNILDKDYSQALYSRPNDPFFSSVNYYGYREEGRSALLSLSWTPQL